MDINKFLEDLEKNIIASALTACRGNMASAAALIGLRRTTLLARARSYDIDVAGIRAAFGAQLGEDILPEDLAPPQVTTRAFAHMKYDAIMKALYETHGNRTHAAYALGISIRCLRLHLTKMRKLGMVIPNPPANTKYQKGQKGRA